MVLLVLALIWVAALLPPFVRSRLEGNPVDSVGRFRRHLRVLKSTSPAASSLAASPSPEAASTGEDMPAIWASEARRLKGMRRRRQLAVTFLITMGATLLLGLLPPLRPLLIVNVVVDAAFAGYLVLLARMRAIETERQMVVHFARLRAAAAAEAEENTAQHEAINAAL